LRVAQVDGVPEEMHKGQKRKAAILRGWVQGSRKEFHREKRAGGITRAGMWGNWGGGRAGG